MRFESPSKFLEFYEKQLKKNVVGLRHPVPIPIGTSMVIIISPPGAPDQLLMNGTATRVTPKAGGTVRLRVSIQLGPKDAAWLDAYLTGLRATLTYQAERPAPNTNADSVPPPAINTRDDLLSLSRRLDAVDYYELIGVDRGVESPILQTRFHALTRQLHPDLFLGSRDREVVTAVNRIYRRMNEAYSVLKNPARRRAYDKGLQAALPGHVRLSESDLEQVRRAEKSRRGITKVGDYYWTQARGVLEAARDTEFNIRPAMEESIRLLRVALAFEPENEHFQNALDQVRHRLATLP